MKMENFFKLENFIKLLCKEFVPQNWKGNLDGNLATVLPLSSPSLASCLYPPPNIRILHSAHPAVKDQDCEIIVAVLCFA